MRILLLSVLATLALGGCNRPSTAPSASGCDKTATHQVTWSNPTAPDAVTTTASGPTCAQAVVTFVLRNANGDPLWAFASTYNAMTAGDGLPPEGAPPVSDADVDAFLASWANVTESNSADLPEWRADAATLSESATTFSYDTPFDRETYESMRARSLPMICYAGGVESSHCLIVDPADGAPIRIVAYGP